MIGPVYSSKSKTVPSGIIQFMNKLGEKHEKANRITDEDVRKFKEFADVIGMAIDNTTMTNSSLEKALNVGVAMAKISHVQDN